MSRTFSRRTLWKIATGVAAASVMFTSLASAVRISGEGPGGGDLETCPQYNPRAVIDDCEDGLLEVPAGAKEFSFTVTNKGELAPAGCPQSALSNVVQANVYGKRGSAPSVLVATIKGDTTLNNLPPNVSQEFILKWTNGRARVGDKGFVFAGQTDEDGTAVPCIVLVV